MLRVRQEGGTIVLEVEPKPPKHQHQPKLLISGVVALVGAAALLTNGILFAVIVISVVVCYHLAAEQEDAAIIRIFPSLGIQLESAHRKQLFLFATPCSPSPSSNHIRCFFLNEVFVKCRVEVVLQMQLVDGTTRVLLLPKLSNRDYVRAFDLLDGELRRTTEG